MARRSDHSREELYELILDAATEIVRKDGLKGLTARNLAKAIGYSAGTLYNLFNNIDDLIIHLNGRTLDQLNDHLSAVRFSGDTKVDVLKLADAYLDYLNQHPTFWQLLFEFNLPDDSDLPDWYHQKISVVLATLERSLEPSFPNNLKGAGESARVLWASFHGICSLSFSGKLPIISDQSVSEMVRLLVANYLEGIRSEP